MDDSCEMQRLEEAEMVSSDSAYGQKPNTFPYNEDLMHKTVLVGDSGVGKTSLLVQFDQGKFISGSFSATVGIDFTQVEAKGDKCTAYLLYDSPAIIFFCCDSDKFGFVSFDIRAAQRS
ncbi:hypothetical protein PAMP_009378 [Pampus punctatissimus]